MGMSFAQYSGCDALELARLIAEGQVAPDDPVKAARAAMAALNPALNALVSPEPDLAPTHPQGPFAGVPLPLKDCVGFLDGLSYSFGSRLATGTIVRGTSSMIARLQEGGFHFLGMSNVPEFSSVVTVESKLHGPVHNPWKKGFSSGGSSGGAAAAVAAGIVPVAYANDGAGSIRVPAACCGMIGLKPSRGRIPTGPNKNDFWHGLMSHGVITRSVRDTAAIIDWCAQLDIGAPYAAPALTRPLASEIGLPLTGLRIAWNTASPYGTPVDAVCVAAVDKLLSHLSASGCQLTEFAPAIDGPRMLADVATLIGVSLAADIPEFAAQHARPADATTVERNNLAWAARGAATSAPALQKLLYRFGSVGRQLGRFFAVGYDLLLTPVTALPPPPHGWLDADGNDLGEYIDRWWRFSPYASLANVSGCPSIALPTGNTSSGLPMGALLTAPYGHDGVLIRVAAELERRGFAATVAPGRH